MIGLLERAACVLLLVSACGRFGFDANDGHAGADAPPADAPVRDAPADAAAVVPPGAIAWWQLDDGGGTTARDAIGTATGMLLAGAGAAPMWTTGYHGGALAFAGDGDFVEAGSPPALTDLPGVTVAAWIDPTSVAAGAHCVVDKGDITAGWYVGVANDSAGDLEFVGDFPTDTVLAETAGGAVAASAWTLVVATWDGGALASGIHLYTNGAELPVTTAMDATGARPSDAGIGLSINCTASTGLAGRIDDVRLWPRALSSTEVRALYDATR